MLATAIENHFGCFTYILFNGTDEVLNRRSIRWLRKNGDGELTGCGNDAYSFILNSKLKS